MKPKFVPVERVKDIIARAAERESDLNVGGRATTIKFLTSPLRASVKFNGAAKFEYGMGQIISLVAEHHQKPAHCVYPVYNEDRTLKGLNIA